ncbi:HEAT repeat domain-containing protein [Desulfallas thermosapovorans]|uniref:HEAT repeat protein n=1 Tax=Desulfallas thermosapovorans DSM 6562 TaxID=1121431 RepID=A0A5S4ZMW9_9FIRM|nr:HEAT repeat domain-containing protein [Desulfallas thermosapovorans]TYO92004.1 HEAT repeat protein [Desulfallas thermosapovorans DSM 6562]
METLIKNLKDAYWKTRAIAAHRLGETGDATAVHPLIEALLDEERVVRDNAVESLGKIGPGAIVPLINILADQDNHQLSGEVSRALVKIGTRAVKPLVCLMEKCLKNCDEVIFTRVASVLGEIGGPEAVLPLINALNEKNPSIRLDSIRALGKIGDGRAVKPIIDVINKYGSSLEAIEALGKLGGSAATSQIKLLDNSRSKIIARPNSLFGKPDIVKKGIFFDQDSWDGSDIFLAGYIFITGRVVEALRKASPKVKNWEAIRASEYERSIILDTVEPGFLTDEDRDKINELRRAIRKEQAQNVEMNREIMARTKITGGKELLHLVRSVVQKHCLFKGMDNHGMCKEILKYLRETGEKVIPQLTGTLKNKDGELRLGAAWLLGELGAKEAIVPLMEALKDEDDRVRREVVTALGKIKDPSTTIPLVELLEKEDSAYVRSGIAEMLGEIGDPIAVQPLISLLHNEEDVLVLSDAATSLGKIGDHRAILPLIELFNYEDSNLAECVKLALVNMGQPAVIPLLQSLDHANPLVRERAAATLGQIGEKKAVLPLIDRLAVEKDQEVLVSIAEALGHLGDKRAVRPLLNLIYTNENSTLKAAAQMAVEKIIDK